MHGQFGRTDFTDDKRAAGRTAAETRQIKGVNSVERLKEDSMLWTITIVLLVLWGLGLVSSYTMGGFIHILLVLAVIVILINIIGGRRRL